MSNLLEKASIITTATAYNVGSINSIKPKENLGSNIVINGDFSNGSTSWIIEAAWTVSDGVANGNGAMGTSQELVQGGNITNGKSYFLTYEIKNYVSGNVKTRGPNTSYRSGNGIYTFPYVANGPLTFVGNSFYGSITNISLKEIIGADFTFTRNTTATRVNSQGLIESVGVDLPRINYENGCGSWLLEPQTTNLITYSEDFSQWIFNNNPTVSSAIFVSPSGENNASLIDLSADTDARVALNFGNNSTEYTFSIYLKKHQSDSDGTFPLAYYNGSDYIKTYVNLTDVWKRFNITFTNPSGGAIGYGLSRKGTTSDETLTRCYAWGGQIEQKAFATSYIPTSGSAKTRNQDSATNAGNSNLMSTAEGVLYAEIAALNNDLSHRRISLSDGTLNNLVYISFDTSSNRILVNANGKVLTHTVSDETEFHKIAVLYNPIAPKLFVNGVLIDTATAMNQITALNQVRFDGGVGNNVFIGKAKCVAVFKDGLTDAELGALTTINISKVFSQRVLSDGGIIESLECVTI
tara:strand:- start:1488 stop:3056 length:1569 start_codon:yes stop_codon:yes gene_type:complete